MTKANGYRGIWYFNQESNDEYKYKYSGGLGTYCAKHIPMACYAKEVNKTFFCYGGSPVKENRLLHMVSFYDHESGKVPRPTFLLDKQTDDAHDNPTIMLDEQGYVWIFSSSHGQSRPSYIHKSTQPYSIDAFDLISETNFSYPQPWYLPGSGFLFLHTSYDSNNHRRLFWMTSEDGRKWSEDNLLAHFGHGHYQLSWRYGRKIGTAFNYHPDSVGRPDSHGLNYRTNLYYLQTDDFGKTWHNVQGELIKPPLKEINNKAMVHDYEADGLLVYMKDMTFDAKGNPVILYVTSKGFESGPENSPRTWTIAHWNGRNWEIRPAMKSDSNYDTGCIHVENDGTWRIIGPTQTGPQPFNPGGEMAMWVSRDEGATWTMEKQLTANSEFNHTYARKPLNAHPDFCAFWADGHARQPSESRLYFCNATGQVYRLPVNMTNDWASPEALE